MPRRHTPVAQPDSLIAVLLDASAPSGDRDDAAMDLAGFDEPDALAALKAVLADSSADADLKESCQESVWEIEHRQR